MKNIALLLLASLNVFFYRHARVEALVQPVRTVVAVAAPKSAAPRVYFHSPLDASAMPTSSYTSMGYYSTDPSSEFRGGFQSATMVGPVVDDAGESASKQVSSWGDASEESGIKALQGVYQLPRVGVPAPAISQ